MSRAISPVIAIVVLMLMTVSAAGMAYLTITTYQEEAQSSSEGAVEQLAKTGQSQIKVESISEGKLYVRSVGDACESMIVQVGGEPAQVLGDCSETQSISVFNINSTCEGGYQTVKITTGGQTITKKVECEEISGFVQEEEETYCGDGNCDPDEDCSTCSQDCGECLSMPWPFYRHDLHNTGYSAEVTSPAQPGVFEIIDYTILSEIGEQASTPLIADINGDNENEILIGSKDKNLRAYYGTNNSILWEKSLHYSNRFVISQQKNKDYANIFCSANPSGTWYLYNNYGPNSTTIWSTTQSVSAHPTVADVNVDGTKETIVPHNNGVKAVYAENGTDLWDYNFGSRVSKIPAVADLDGDGITEVIVTGSTSNSLYVIYGTNGTLKWNYNVGGSVFTAPVIADVNQDGDLEIITGSDNDKVTVLYENGTLMWDYTISNEVERSAAVADINNDNELEVVFIGYDEVYALHAKNGTQFWIHNEPDTRNKLSPTVIGDADGNGIMDVMYSKIDMSDCARLVILYGTNGTEQTNQTFTCGLSTDYTTPESPSLGDVDQDGIVEILFTIHYFTPQMI